MSVTRESVDRVDGTGRPVTTPVLSDVMRLSAEYLKSRGIDTPRLDAELIVASALGVSRVDLYVDFERPLTIPERDTIKSMLRRRGGREPLQYVIGRQGFRRLDLLVTPDVLIPRPETEVLVESALEKLAVARGQGATVLDLGTGSGAVALSLAFEAPGCAVTAVDCSEAALAVAAGNAAAHGLTEQVSFRLGDYFSALGQGDRGRFDVIAANLPYVPAADIDGLQPEVGRWEPRAALDGGLDGLDAFRRVIPAAGDYLRPGGWIILEVGEGQSPAVVELLAGSGFSSIDVAKDLAMIDRVVSGRLPGLSR